MRNENEINVQYNTWLNNIKDEKQLHTLKHMNQQQIDEAFGSDLEFGTGGLRGIIGLGTAKMNTYNVSKVTRGLVEYLKKNFTSDLKVAISSDPRHKSQQFIELIASILAQNGISSIIYDDIKPTPMLSFLVREKSCQAGIMITASHNTKEYNGYKVYNQTGAQLDLDQSALMIKEVEKQQYDFCEQITPINDLVNECKVQYITEDFDQVYFDNIKDVVKNKDPKDIKITFTPEHGTMYKIMPKAFKQFGFENVIGVKEQMIPDGDFPNTLSANPEDIVAYELALKYAQKDDSDLIIANDPDGDRLGILFKSKAGQYKPLSGNQTGALLVDYLIKRDNIKNGIIYNTIVTGELGGKIVKANGLKLKQTLTGFKFIGEQIELNKEDKFVFGYEESYGYLISPCVRDKDAIQSSLLIAEMTQYYKDQNMDLEEVLNTLYEQYGYSYEVTNSITLSGLDGMQKIKKVMTYYQENEISSFAQYKVSSKIDYNQKQKGLPKSNVVKFFIEDYGWVVFRPSGTEPKLKVYICINSSSIENSKKIADEIYEQVLNKINSL